MKKLISYILTILIIFSPFTALATINSDGAKKTPPKKATSTKTLKVETKTKYKVTLHFEKIRTPQGKYKSSSQSNELDSVSGWNWTQKKLDNQITTKEFDYFGIHYKYTGNWIDKNGNPVTIPVSIKGKDLTGDTDLYYYPVYEITPIKKLEYRYIDNISTASGGWRNIDSFESVSHTFKEPDPQKHYKFIIWRDKEHNNEYNPGDTMTYKAPAANGPDEIIISVYAMWQPSVILIYDDNGEISEEESFENLTVEKEPNIPKGYRLKGWFDENGNEVSSTTYSAPEITHEADSYITKRVTAKYELIPEPGPEEKPEKPTTPSSKPSDKKPTKISEDPKPIKSSTINRTTTTFVRPSATTTKPIQPKKLKSSKAIITDEPIPLIKAPIGKWALINLVCTILTALISIIMLIRKLIPRRKKEEENEEEKKTTKKKIKLLPTLFGILVAIASIFIFLITEDMTLPMQLIDKYTLLMAILLIVNLIMLLVQSKKKEKTKETDERETR